MNEPERFDVSEDQWAGISDEVLLQRVSNLLGQTAPDPSDDMEAKARQGLELIRKLAGLVPESARGLSRACDSTGQFEGDAAGVAPSPSAQYEPVGLREGAVLGHKYRLIERIGEGGMGTVWVGQQLQPVQRLVAIKTVKAGMDSHQVLRRFELERQSLSAMDHPNISRILDAGLTETQSPFFVMELVRGSSLLQYCDDSQLGIRQRLKLFIQVIQGVQHAHQKGIVHRDLKPTNILVQVVDDCPIPKIIDFGLAKALDKSHSEESQATSHGAIIGTLEYMAPEQAGYREQDIDTRADVYSLGVILYELLVGLRPFDQGQLEKAAYEEKLRIIREEDPVRPSLRLSSSEESLHSASMRQTEPRSLTDMLRNELDWVVMKALDKDRSRRYATAHDFAEDLQRYLASEPVLAHPPSKIYRLQKFVRRNRAAVVASTLVLLSLVLGLAGTLWQAQMARQESRRADERANEAERAVGEQRRLASLEAAQRQEAQKQSDLAQKAALSEKQRSEQLQQAAAFQSKMLSNINLPDAGQNLGTSLKRRLDESLTGLSVGANEKEARLASFSVELDAINTADTAIELIDAMILQPALKELDESSQQQPQMDATLRRGLSDAYRNLGNYPTAIELMEKALADRQSVLGENHPDTINAKGDLGLLYQEAGQLGKAEPLIRDALSRSVQHNGEDHIDSIAATNNLGLLRRAQGKMDEAEQLFREAIDRGTRVLGPDDSQTVSFTANLALTLTEQRKYPQAEPLARQVLEQRRRLQGNDHHDTLVAINNLGMLLGEMGAFEECEALTREGLTMTRKLLGESHPQTIIILANLGSLYFRQAHPTEAEPLMRESYEKSLQVLGPTHGQTLEIANSLANVLASLEKLDEAATIRQDILTRSKTTLGMDHPMTLRFMNNLANLLEKKSSLVEAHAIRVELLDRYRDLRGPNDVLTLSATVNLANNLDRQEKYAEAEGPFREVVGISTRTKGASHPNTAVAKGLLGENLKKQGRFADAEPEMLESEKILSSHPESTAPRHRQSVSALISLYKVWDEREPSEDRTRKSRHWQDALKKLDQINVERGDRSE